MIYIGFVHWQEENYWQCGAYLHDLELYASPEEEPEIQSMREQIYAQTMGIA